MKNVAKCDTWCELQNPVNHRVFERKLRPKPLGRGHACLGVTHRFPNATCNNVAARAPASWLVEIWVHGRLRRDKMVDEPRSRPITCEPVSSGPIDDPLRARTLPTRPQVRRGYPLSLSISISGGKETNKDSLSNGERTGKSPP
ncbi:hypothetical protein GLYMA_U007802v4 [Glycine max]|uniref:Uncharacterized protein n=1 Tax=Glycine max TaxID=3847 RepID=K7LYM5_SOYBN|nr:hypothetical protein GLYMA_U007802v4 [Glycine max]